MADVIQGPVISVTDGDTFDMRVTRVGTSNRYPYNDSEIIRVASIDAPELNTQAGKRSKDALEMKLRGRTVTCAVQSRDVYGRVVADVRVS